MWIKYSEEKPGPDSKVWYYFEVVGVHQGTYHADGTFAGKNGFLLGDVTHWQYDQGQSRPKPPKS